MALPIVRACCFYKSYTIQQTACARAGCDCHALTWMPCLLHHYAHTIHTCRSRTLILSLALLLLEGNCPRRGLGDPSHLNPHCPFALVPLGRPLRHVAECQTRLHASSCTVVSLDGANRPNCLLLLLLLSTLAQLGRHTVVNELHHEGVDAWDGGKAEGGRRTWRACVRATQCNSPKLHKRNAYVEPQIYLNGTRSGEFSQVRSQTYAHELCLPRCWSRRGTCVNSSTPPPRPSSALPCHGFVLSRVNNVVSPAVAAPSTPAQHCRYSITTSAHTTARTACPNLHSYRPVTRT